MLYTLLYKKHPFSDAQKLAIINAHYYTPIISGYSEKLLDFMRLLLSPSPEKRPDIKKVIQIVQNWDVISKIELSKEVLEIKMKQVENNKKSGEEAKKFTVDELNSISQQIIDQQKKMEKKNPYKYQKKNDDENIDEVFDEFVESSESKINATVHNSGGNGKNNNNNNNNSKGSGQKQPNWMNESGNNNKGSYSQVKNTSQFDQNAFLNFDFIEPTTNNFGNDGFFQNSTFKFEVQNTDNNETKNNPSMNRSKSPNMVVNNNNKMNSAPSNKENNRSKSPLIPKKGDEQNVYNFFK